jgi:hypothetical protein
MEEGIVVPRDRARIAIVYVELVNVYSSFTPPLPGDVIIQAMSSQHEERTPGCILASSTTSPVILYLSV